MILGVYCAGGFGGVTYELATEVNVGNARWEKILYIDDAPEKFEQDNNILTFEQFTATYRPEEAEIIIAAGEPRLREYLFNKVKACGYYVPNIIHPMANAQKITKIGEGNIILNFSYISASNVTMGNNNIVMPYAQISHDNIIGSHCVITSAANLSGTTVLGDRVYIGVGAKLRESITIGHDAIVGMGAIVVKSVDEESVVMGLPAKEVRKNTGKVFKG